MHAGEFIRQRRLEMGLRPSQVEGMSHAFGGRLQDSRCYISHSTLAGIEAGTLPSLYKMLSLAYCLRLTDEQILDWYGVDLPAIRPILRRRAAAHPVDQQHIPGPAKQGTTFPFRWPSGPAPPKTSLLPKEVADELEGDKPLFRFARIGSRDESMLDILPPGSMARVDTRQNQVLVFPWTTMWHRPIYLVWHAFGYSCGWCQHNRSELVLLPHPGSHRPIATFSFPEKASVIGRVVAMWASPEDIPLELPGVHRIPLAEAHPQAG